jgi:hypothetical protein
VCSIGGGGGVSLIIGTSPRRAASAARKRAMAMSPGSVASGSLVSKNGIVVLSRV